MSLLLQNPLSNLSYRVKFHLSSNQYNRSEISKLSLFPNPLNPPPCQSLNGNGFPLRRNLYLPRNRHCHIKAYDSTSFAFEQTEQSSKQFNFDALLSVLESFCLVSSLVIAVGCVANWVFFRQQYAGLVALGNKTLVWFLAGAVAVGSIIRRRHWRRVCGPLPSKPTSGAEFGNVIERIEKLEDSMKSATTIIRMLSRQLEKLGIRFRVTRKAVRDPISETAALAQKNSEATRALAVQEGILEKELAEVQKVLLAMQDQQQKQLELILAIAKSGKLIETKEASTSGPSVHEKGSGIRGLRQVDGQQMQAIVGQSGATNDKVLET